MSVLAEASRLLAARLAELDAEIDRLTAERGEVRRALRAIERPRDRPGAGRVSDGTTERALGALRELGPSTAPQVVDWLRGQGYDQGSHRPVEVVRNALQRAMLRNEVWQPRRGVYALVPESGDSGQSN